jgi:hypothetical protein
MQRRRNLNPEPKSAPIKPDVTPTIKKDEANEVDEKSEAQAGLKRHGEGLYIDT